ncbi:MAG: hypothetical protein SPL61_13265 [Saccharofermentans sp.]|jgi:uncharacterized protein Yka (UPF0111/DUF47 family)|nr:hypothetical protein [Saccharofermentans sp.]
MTIEDREYLFDHAQQLSEILNEECVELLGMLEKIEDRVAISKRINKLEDDGDHIFHAFADRLHQVEPDSEKRMTIFQMARHIEDCIDMVDELSMTIVRYNTRTVNPGMKASVNAIAGCVKKEMHLLNILRTYEPENKELFLRAINEFDAFKVDFYKMYDMLIFGLFSQAHDTVDIIRCKAIYDAVKDIFKAFEVSADDCYKYVMARSNDSDIWAVDKK